MRGEQQRPAIVYERTFLCPVNNETLDCAAKYRFPQSTLYVSSLQEPVFIRCVFGVMCLRAGLAKSNTQKCIHCHARSRIDVSIHLLFIAFVVDYSKSGFVKFQMHIKLFLAGSK